MQVSIAAITIPETDRPEFRENVDDLAKHIEENGLYRPIIIDRDYQLLAGYRRLKAYQQLGRTEIPAEIIE
jgi:ParB family chromosome partitioning protein